MKTNILLIIVAVTMLSSCAARTGLSKRQDATSETKNSEVKTEETLSLQDLGGEWRIISLYGNDSISSPVYGRAPYMHFSIADKRLSASVGCNIMNASIKTDRTAPRSLSFGQGISTMMACPDMDLEHSLSSLLQDCRSFAIRKGMLHLYSAEGKSIATLKR